MSASSPHPTPSPGRIEAVIQRGGVQCLLSGHVFITQGVHCAYLKARRTAPNLSHDALLQRAGLATDRLGIIRSANLHGRS